VFSEEDEEGSGEPMTRWHVVGDDEEAAWYLTRIRPSRSGEGRSPTTEACDKQRKRNARERRYGVSLSFAGAPEQGCVL
jgi:hypothetical protein